MRRVLEPHPDFRPPSIGLEVEAFRPGPCSLSLRYSLTGRTQDLRIAPPAASRRVDELWRRTCCEAFIRAGTGEAYYELNLAPSTEWAAYRLSGYREGLAPVADIDAPRIKIQTSDDRLVLTATIDLSCVSDLPPDAPWALGLSAVIEAADGSKSYWALVHPPGKPDFHHPDCFALRLEAPDRA
jgi:hypothetical protein